MLGKPDPLAGLDDLEPSGARPFRVDQLFGDQTSQLERIRSAFLRGVSPRQIADYLTEQGYKISDSAVDSWLKKEGVKR